MKRTVAAALAMAVVLALIAGCTGTPKPRTVTGQSAQVSPSAQTTLRFRGISVTLPANAISHSGTLKITPVTESGLREWSITLAGAKLTGHVSITFTKSLAKGEPAPIVGHKALPNRAFSPVGHVSIDGSGATVTTNHLSYWFVDWWSDIKTKATGFWNVLFSRSVKGAKPSCVGEDTIRAAGYQITSSIDHRVFWCMGTDASGDRPELTIVNSRGHPVVVQASANLLLTNPDHSSESVLPHDLAALVQPNLPAGQSVHILPGENTYTYRDVSGGSAAITVVESGPGYVASALLYWVETITMLASVLGKSPTVHYLLNAMDTDNCVAGFKSMASDSVTTTNEASTYLDKAVNIAMDDCMPGAVNALFGSDSDVATGLLAGLAWLVSGIEEITKVTQAVKGIFADPTSYYITISHGLTVTHAQLGSLTAPAMCLRPQGRMVNGSLPVPDPLLNGNTDIVGFDQNQAMIASGSTSTPGKPLLAVAFYCSAGGVNLPDVIGIYTPSYNLITSIDLGEIDNQEHSNVMNLAFSDGDLHIDWLTNDDCHHGADVSVPRSADFSISESGHVSVSNSVTGASPYPCTS